MPNMLLLVVICGVIISGHTPVVDSVPFSCLPRTDEDPCPPDHEIAQCTTRGTKDKCVPCAPGLRMCDATTSTFPSECYDPRDFCSADGDNVVQVIDDPEVGCTIRCLCNERAGFTGPDPLQCQSYDQACDQSSYHELDSSQCLPCTENYHNPKDDGLDKCVLRSTSSSTAAKRRPLVVLPTSTATPRQPVSAATMTPSAVLDTNNKLDNGNDIQRIQAPKDSNTNISSRWSFWFSIAIVACGIIVVVVAACCCRKRKTDSVDRRNAQNRICICCVFGSVSSCPGSAVINEGLPAENHQLLVRDGTKEPIESLPRQPIDQPEQPAHPIDQTQQPEHPIDQPEQPEQPIDQPQQPEQPIDQPQQPEQPIDQPQQPEHPIDQPEVPEYTGKRRQPKHCGSLPSYDPPPYSPGQYRHGGMETPVNFDSMTLSDSDHMTTRTGAVGPDTTLRKKEIVLNEGELLDPTSQDGPRAMTARTICATTPQHSSLQGQQNTCLKSVVKEGHLTEVSETEKKRPISDPSQPQPQPCVVDSRNHSLRSEPPSLGGESLHVSSFKSGPTPTL